MIARRLCAAFFLVFILLLVSAHRSLLRDRDFTTVTGRSQLVEKPFSARWRWLGCVISLLYIAIMIVLPLATRLMGTFMELFGHFDLERTWTSRHWTGTFNNPMFLRSLKNTTLVALSAAISGTLVYALLSYLIVRGRLPGRGIIDVLSWLPWALPGVLISLALLWAVLGSGDSVKLLYGTVRLLVIAIVIKELPLGTQIIKAAVQQIGPELEEASSAAGANWFEYFRRILLPAPEAYHPVGRDHRLHLGRTRYSDRGVSSHA